ncbi:SDR family oxidoreductase [Kutzneria viridogrisea]
MVTGATDGIGRAVAHRLAGMVDTLLVHGRGARSVMDLAAALAPAHPGTTIIPLKADLCSMAEIHYMINRVCTAVDQLDIVVNNAGTAGIYPRTVTRDGNEATLQVNYLAPVMITAGLFDLLCLAEHGRVVNVTCDSYRNAKLRWHDLSLEQRYHPMTAYAQSKLAVVLHTQGLADRLSASSCDAVCVNPGNADTKLHRRAFGWHAESVTGAVDNVLYAITAPLDGTGFYFNRKELTTPAVELFRPHVQRHLDRVTAGLLSTRLPWLERVHVHLPRSTAS